VYKNFVFLHRKKINVVKNLENDCASLEILSLILKEVRMLRYVEGSVLFLTRLLVHQRMNANGNSTKWFIFLKQ
jgi:hypothetical protein